MLTPNGNTGYSDWSACDRCRLSETRRRVVLRRDSPRRRKTHLLIIADSPRSADEARGTPISGEDYQILLGEAGIIERIPEDFSYTITYIICCSPPERRPPTVAEAELCRPHINELIRSVNPTGIVYLGPIAEKHYPTKLPSVTISSMGKILREEFRLLPVIKNARKLQLFIQGLQTFVPTKTN